MRGEPISATDALVRPHLAASWYRTAFGEGPISGRWSAQWWGWAQRNLAVAATPDLERFEGPVLWFLAELDENVPLVSTRAALERAFAASAGDDHEIVVLEGALHSFLVPSPDGPPRFSRGFFQRMGDWMTERGLSGETCPGD
jgi:alpha-beta hydrolase superfamily lysophospholipase